MSCTGFDPEAAKHTEGEFKRQGIQLKPDFSPVKVVKEKDGKLTMTAKNNKDEETTLEGIDCILMATGRKPATQGLGLDKVCGTSVTQYVVLAVLRCENATDGVIGSDTFSIPPTSDAVWNSNSVQQLLCMHRSDLNSMAVLSSLLVCSVKAERCCCTCAQAAGGKLQVVRFLLCAAILSWHAGMHTHIRLTLTRL